MSTHEIRTILEGAYIPEWETLGRLVSALHGRPETIRPLWAAAIRSQLHSAAAGASCLPAGAFG
ncbi:hypothetical protein DEJ48_39220 [Streptomyces venezuelae]|uniref:Uncharacterized protein n=1 Tax=Streptomyces venezuelae TaxID=54571 RepID=A0A5P2C8R3_STRVZ|nr:hypothetical protein [Streptomyces venezuelae]QES38630.1 hypothetical protein DEJ48_39220 [Streptomyces venezuelae]